MQKKTRGFTLIELLVVIAIIAILAAILFPVFASAREQSKKAKCLSNLKQIGMQVHMYTDDNRGLMPLARDPSDGTYWDAKTAVLTPIIWDAMMPYAKTAKHWRCDSDKGYYTNLTFRYVDEAGKPQVGKVPGTLPTGVPLFTPLHKIHKGGSYWFNTRLATVNLPGGQKRPNYPYTGKLESIPEPARMTVLYEPGYFHSTDALAFVESTHVRGDARFYAVGRTLALFADGHAAEMPYGKWVTESYAYTDTICGPY